MRPNPMTKFIGIGFEAVVLIAVGAWVGQFLDTKFALKGLGTAGAVISALVIWLLHVLLLLRDTRKHQ